jgi:hypothetical protein
VYQNHYITFVLTVAVVAPVAGVTKQVHCSEMVRDLLEQAELMTEGMAVVAVISLAVYVAQKLVTNAPLAEKTDAHG